MSDIAKRIQELETELKELRAKSVVKSNRLYWGRLVLGYKMKALSRILIITSNELTAYDSSNGDFCSCKSLEPNTSILMGQKIQIGDSTDTYYIIDEEFGDE